jgi:hypothetical protein
MFPLFPVRPLYHYEKNGKNRYGPGRAPSGKMAGLIPGVGDKGLKCQFWYILAQAKCRFAYIWCRSRVEYPDFPMVRVLQ